MNMLNRDLGMGDLCDNIGLVGVSAKWSYVTASPSHHNKAIPILSPCFLCMLAIPIFPFLKFEEFLIYLYILSCDMGILKMHLCFASFSPGLHGLFNLKILLDIPCLICKSLDESDIDTSSATFTGT